MRHRIAVTFTASAALCGLLFAASPARAAEPAQAESIVGVAASPAASTTSTPDVPDLPPTNPLPAATPTSDAEPQLASGTVDQPHEVREPPQGGGTGTGGETVPPTSPPPPGTETDGATVPPPSVPPTDEPAPPSETPPPPVEQAEPDVSEAPGDPSTAPGTGAPGTTEPVPTDPAASPAPEETGGPGPAGEPPSGTDNAPVEDKDPVDGKDPGPKPVKPAPPAFQADFGSIELPDGFEDWSVDEQEYWLLEELAGQVDDYLAEHEDQLDSAEVRSAAEQIAHLLETGTEEDLLSFLETEFGARYAYLLPWVLVGLLQDGVVDGDEADEVIGKAPAGLPGRLPERPETPGAKPGNPEGFETPPALVPVGPAADVVAAGNVEGAADASSDSRSRRLAVTGTDTVVRAGAAGLALLVAGGLLIRLGSRRHRAG